MNPKAIQQAVKDLMGLSDEALKRRMAQGKGAEMVESPASHEQGESDEYEAKEKAGEVVDAAPEDSDSSDELMAALQAALEKKKQEE